MGSASLELPPSVETAPLIRSPPIRSPPIRSPPIKPPPIRSPLSIPVDVGAAIPVEETVRDPEAPTLYAIDPEGRMKLETGGFTHMISVGTGSEGWRREMNNKDWDRKGLIEKRTERTELREKN